MVFQLRIRREKHGGATLRNGRLHAIKLWSDSAPWWLYIQLINIKVTESND